MKKQIKITTLVEEVIEHEIPLEIEVDEDFDITDRQALNDLAHDMYDDLVQETCENAHVKDCDVSVKRVMDVEEME